MEEIYKQLYDKIFLTDGYKPGDEMSFFDFSIICEDMSIDYDDIDLEYFCEKYDITIG